MKFFEKVFGADRNKRNSKMKDKVIDSGRVQYMGGHKDYPQPQWTEVFFYEDRFELEVHNLTIPYAKIKDIGNSKESKRDPDRLAFGLLFPPVALAYLWKRDHIYTIVVYDDGVDTQKIVLDFDNNANYAQELIYKKMLESRNKKDT